MATSAGSLRPAHPLRGAVFGAVMGTQAHVLLSGAGDADAAILLDQLRSLERRWSRFIDTSELSRLGRLSGGPAVVSWETALLIRRSIDAGRLTDGLFDATLLGPLEAAGYDRSFEQLAHRIAEREPAAALDATDRAPVPVEWPSPALAGVIEADPDTGLVVLPAGVRIDPGGLGKGLAADLVAAAALDRGAEGALVSVGGDLRAVGEPPPEGWEIEIDHHVAAPARLNLRTGAVATSSRLRRRWRTDHGIAHHVIDPRTRRPSTGPAVAVSVVADEGWRAEAVATALLIGFGTPGVDERGGDLVGDGAALVTTADGRRHVLGPVGHAFVVPDEDDRVGRPSQHEEDRR